MDTGISPHDFDGSGPVDALVASVTSLDDADVRAAIDLYWTLPGEAERAGADASTRREPGDVELKLSTALLAADFPAGTNVRAVFTVTDIDGVARTFTRQITLR